MGGWNGWLFSAYLVIIGGVVLYSLKLALQERRVRAEELELAGRRGGLEPYGSGWWADVLATLALLGLAVTTYMAFQYAPTEKTMGTVQRIFYFHVPAAWIAFLAFLVVAVASVVYLWKRSEAADLVASSAAEIGVLFTSFVLITGPLWAKPVWFVWWTWDARLTSTLVLWLIYAGYLMLRSQIDEPGRRATLAAVVGILGFVDVPIVYFSIRWWRTQHPQPVIAGGEGSGLHPLMAHAFLTSLATFTLLFLALLWRRASLAARERRLERLARESESA
jgi:heme exporter protein C